MMAPKIRHLVVATVLGMVVVSQLAGSAASHSDDDHEVGLLIDDGDDRGQPVGGPVGASLQERRSVVREARDRFDLPTDDETLDVVVDDVAAWRAGASMGLPLLPEEVELMARRGDFQSAAIPHIDEVRKRNDADFSGVWIDFNNRELHISYASERAAELAAAIELPEGSTVIAHVVEFTYSELASASAEVVEFAEDGKPPIEVAGGGVDEVANQVVIYTPADLTRSREYADSFEADLGLPARMFRFEPGGGEIILDSTPRGGQRMSSCSLGPYNYVNTVWGPIYFASTAAHCNNTLYHYDPSFHNPAYRMDKTTNIWGSTVTADAQTMYADNGGLTPITSYVEGWASPDFRLTSITGWHSGHDAVGMIVCQSGHATAGSGNCGQILSPLNWSCGGYVNFRRTDYASVNNDSGATVYGFAWGSYNVPLIGLHTGHAGGGCGAQPGTKLFTHQQPARQQLGITNWHVG